MEEDQDNIDYEEIDEKKFGNDIYENSTEHINRPLINIEEKEINNNEKEKDKKNENVIKDNYNLNNQELISKIPKEIKIENNNKDNKENNNKKYHENLSISNCNFNLITDINNNKDENTQKTNNYTFKINNYENITKFNTEFPYDKYRNYNDEIKIYYFNKEFSKFHINTEENFMERMKFDIYKRQIKEKKLDDFIKNNKVYLKEENKIKTFNHLIEDANRRLKAQINSKILNTQLDNDLISKKESKKYNYNEWDSIYEKKFKNYLNKVNHKINERKKKEEEEKQKKEEEILKLCPNKKAPIKQIKEISEKMYDEAMKRIIKKKQKIYKLYNDSKINGYSFNLYNTKKEEKYSNENNIINLKNKFLTNNMNKIKVYKSTSKISKKNKNNMTHNNINKKFMNGISDIINSEYDIEKERQILIDMALNKKIPEKKK